MTGGCLPKRPPGRGPKSLTSVHERPKDLDHDDGFAGPDHAAHAVDAARELLQRTGNDEAEPWLPVGAGIHLGKAYIGTVGQEEALDFTALGDPVNTAARLAGVAGAGEIHVSEIAARAGEATNALQIVIPFSLPGPPQLKIAPPQSVTSRPR